MTVALLFLGQLTIQANAFLPYLSKNGYDVTALNTAPWYSPKKIEGTNIPVYNLYEGSKISSKLKGQLDWFAKAGIYSVAKKLKLKNHRLKQIIDEADIDIIYGSWGSLSLPEIGMAQEFHVPTVYEFLTYPTTNIITSQKFENFFNRGIVNNLEGRVLSTKRMLSYMKKEFGLHNGENLVFMECYPEKFFFRKKLPLLSTLDGQPHVVFIGMDVGDILPQIEAVASKRIHVHMCNPNQTGWNITPSDEGLNLNDEYINSRFIHFFNRFTYEEIADGTFATFLTQFDACLVTYNFWNASGISRYNNSIPSRFSIGILAGIPIVIPKGYMNGCEEIIDEYQIGFEYETYSDLNQKIRNKNMLNYYQNRASENSKVFSLEKNFLKIADFLKRIIG